MSTNPPQAAQAYAVECRRVLLEELAHIASDEALNGGSGSHMIKGESSNDDSIGNGTRTGACSANVDGGDMLDGGRTLVDDERAPGPVGDEDEYEVESILGERKRRVHGNIYRQEYLVKWTGYAETTWEPHEHVEACSPFKVYLESKSLIKCDACLGKHVAHTCGKALCKSKPLADPHGCAACRGKHVAHTCGKRQQKRGA